MVSHDLQPNMDKTNLLCACHKSDFARQIGDITSGIVLWFGEKETHGGKISVKYTKTEREG